MVPMKKKSKLVQFSLSFSIVVITPSLDGDHEKKPLKLLITYVGSCDVKGEKLYWYIGYYAHQLQYLKKQKH